MLQTLSCAALLLNIFFQTIEELRNFFLSLCHESAQTLAWFRWQCRNFSWFFRSWAEGTSQELGLRWWLGSLSSLDLRGELSVPRGGRSPEDAHLPFSCPGGEGEGSPDLNCVKLAKYENIRVSDSNPCFCISYNAFHKVINLEFKPV